MKLERYPYNVGNKFLEYEFVSEGPKGAIPIKVEIQRETKLSNSIFNLGFGKWNEIERKIEDLARTNNGDTKKILATVAKIVKVFTDQYGDVLVIAEGSTPSRTRLYQMGIVAHYQEIENIFHIYGYKDHEWQLFKKGVNYEAFAVRRKTTSFTEQVAADEIKE